MGGMALICLAQLAPKLPEALRAEVLREALNAVTDKGKDWANAKALSILVPMLPSELVPKALTAARAIQSKEERAKVLVVLAAKLPEVVPEAFVAVRDMRSNYTRAITLANLVPHLPPELLFEAFVIAQNINVRKPHWIVRVNRDRTIALMAIASAMLKMQTSDLLPLWQKVLHSLSSQSRQNLHTLLTLAEVIHVLGGKEAMAETLAAIQEVERWWP